eukprot:TRINITY_DN59_c0_g1_i1.p1 TRINITY_DN59_c0_g1~~TRINITY_DN59_c0_g1_i1.p1  ORF type:complete len:733 (+),score=81.47 TRINITY_DN59_c0_g1_i1:68-2266(+)
MADAEAVGYLRDKQVYDHVNRFVEKLIEDRPDDVQAYLIKMMEAMKRTNGKGQKATQQVMKYGGGGYGGGGLQQGPEHIHRDPRVWPKAGEILPNCIYVKPTRSFIEPVSKRADYSTTVGALYATAAAECKAQVNSIIKLCTERGKKFFDNSFYFDRRRNMYPKGSPADCTVTEPTMSMRASDLYPKAPLFASGTAANDISQGAVGDCFFIGAVSALASCTAQHLRPIQRLFVNYNVEYGVYGVCFFKCGGWEWVIVDDYIAVQQMQDGRWSPLYASPSAQAELWPMILEKAYAKIHFNWDTIDGGWGKEAVGDMTGGLEYNLDLYRANRNMTFAEIKRLCDDPMTILGCAIGQHVGTSNGPSGGAGEQAGLYGLYHGHAYSVIAAAQTSDGTGFIRVRNPWGNWAEWQGPYADGSREWELNPQHKRELNPSFKDDGAFWMKWEDFHQYFTNIDVNRYFPDNWVVLTMFSTAPKYDQLPSNTYILHVKNDTTTIVATLGQNDPKSNMDHQMQYQQMSDIRLSVYKLSGLPRNFASMIEYLDWKFETPNVYARCVDHQFELEPGYYSLMPKVGYSGVGVYIRVFADPSSEVELWRYSDGRQSAMSVQHGHSYGSSMLAAAEQKAVAVADRREWPASVKPVLRELGISSNASLVQHATEAFNRHDVFNAGRLDKEHATNAFRQLLGGPELEKTIGDSFNKFDRLGDGHIDRQGFLDFAHELLGKWGAKLTVRRQ